MMFGDLDQQYVLARRVLLDALDALEQHRDAVVLVGAQAIYLHVGEADMAVPPFTTDGDLALNPGTLTHDPLLEPLLRQAGFIESSEHGEVGTWIGVAGIKIDLMVPEALGGPGRRGARLGPHGSRVARKARGLEAAIVDHSEMTVHALQGDDPRALHVRVAGPSALLVAKLHKLYDRRDAPRRQDNKDAYDILRLLRGVPIDLLGQGIRGLTAASLSADVTREAVVHLEQLFGTPVAMGSSLAADHVNTGLDDPQTVAASCAALAQDLLDEIHRIPS